MTTKPKSAIDPVFAAIAEHKALIKETDCLEDSRAVRAESKAAMRMARTMPTTRAGVEAIIHHAWQATETDREVDWRQEGQNK